MFAEAPSFHAHGGEALCGSHLVQQSSAHLARKGAVHSQRGDEDDVSSCQMQPLRSMRRSRIPPQQRHCEEVSPRSHMGFVELLLLEVEQAQSQVQAKASNPTSFLAFNSTDQQNSTRL